MKLIICNLCEKAMQYHKDLPSDISKPGKTVSITNGSHYEDVCYDCVGKIEKFINTLKKSSATSTKILN